MDTTKIKISNGEVEMINIIRRPAHKAYQKELFRDAVYRDIKDEYGNSDVETRINAAQITCANECLVIDMALTFKADNSEGKVEVNEEFIANMQQKDFELLEAHAVKIKEGKEDQAKKS